VLGLKPIVSEEIKGKMIITSIYIAGTVSEGIITLVAV